MELRARAFGLAVGIAWGLGIFIVTIWAVLLGTGNTLRLLSTFYYGYSVDIDGAFVGLFWGFVDGFLFGAAVAWLYNMLQKAIYKTGTSL